MKIDIRYTFQQLKTGDTFFCLSKKSYFMRTSDQLTNDAVNLKNGEVIVFKDNDEVIPVNLKISLIRGGLNDKQISNRS